MTSDSLAEFEPTARDLLCDLLRISSVSGEESALVHFVRDFAVAAGFSIDLWQADEATLPPHPVLACKHLPLKNRPTLVVGIEAPTNAPSVLFNAHSDVVAADMAEWTHPAGAFVDGKFFGRGACDVKGALVSALWAMLTVQRFVPFERRPNLKLELVPGEEDCVTLGTYTSVVRGHTADMAVVLEPTECQPRNASRPGVRFVVTCSGTAVHGTVKWLGHDAIMLSQVVLECLAEMEVRWNDRTADPAFVGYPIARPITVDTIHGGRWQGMVADRCIVAGYLELLPSDDVDASMVKFANDLLKSLATDGQDCGRVGIEFVEKYAGHQTPSAGRLCQVAKKMMGESFVWAGFNSGCEAGLRANLLGTPTLVWGPGSLAQAHAVDEFVEWDQVRAVAGMFGRFAVSLKD